MTSVALIGFGSPESLRLANELRARERRLDLIANEGPNPSSIPEADTALVWFAGINGAQAARVVEECVASGMPVVAIMPAVTTGGIDPTRGTVDFVFPPHGPDEVAVRLRNAHARASGPRGNMVVHGELTLDLDRYEVTLAGKKVDLTYKEYELLKYLAMNPGRVFSREALLRSVWEYDYFGGTRTVDVHIRRLRSKIEDVRHRFIETVWNVGYRFRSPDESEAG